MLPTTTEGRDAAPEKKSLNSMRMSAVAGALKRAGASSVIDLGCGEGSLLELLLKDDGFTRLAGVDVSLPVLDRAARRLDLDTTPELRNSRICLFQGSLVHRDDRFAGYDAAAVVEVIEHLDKGMVTAFEQVVFGTARPPVVVLTTPNAEYNARYESLAPGRLRHPDHRFEWTRLEFTEWAEAVAKWHGYAATYHDVGDFDEDLGSPTQMGVFTLCGEKVPPRA